MYEELNAHACIMQMEKYTHLYNYHLLWRLSNRITSSWAFLYYKLLPTILPSKQVSPQGVVKVTKNNEKSFQARSYNSFSKLSWLVHTFKQSQQASCDILFIRCESWVEPNTAATETTEFQSFVVPRSQSTNVTCLGVSAPVCSCFASWWNEDESELLRSAAGKFQCSTQQCL